MSSQCHGYGSLIGKGLCWHGALLAIALLAMLAMLCYGYQQSDRQQSPMPAEPFANERAIAMAVSHETGFWGADSTVVG